MAALATSPAVVLQDLPVRRIDDDDEGEESTILTLSAGKQLVMDCWTTRCERCPAALAKLNDFAGEYEKADDVLFLSVCLDDEDFGKELVEEWECENMTHVFMELADKEKLKAQFGFNSVPFILVTADDRGTVALEGGLKKCSLEAVRAALEGKGAAASEKEVAGGSATQQAINVESPPQAQQAPAPATSAAATAEGPIPTFTFGEDEDF